MPCGITERVLGLEANDGSLNSAAASYLLSSPKAFTLSEPIQEALFLSWDFCG